MKRVHTVFWWVSVQLALWTTLCIIAAQIARSLGLEEVSWVTGTGVLSFVLLPSTVILTRAFKYQTSEQTATVTTRAKKFSVSTLISIAVAPVSILLAVVLFVPAFTSLSF